MASRRTHRGSRLRRFVALFLVGLEGPSWVGAEEDFADINADDPALVALVQALGLNEAHIEGLGEEDAVGFLCTDQEGASVLRRDVLVSALPTRHGFVNLDDDDLHDRD